MVIIFGLGGSYCLVNVTHKIIFSASWTLQESSGVPRYVETFEFPNWFYFLLGLKSRNDVFWD